MMSEFKTYKLDEILTFKYGKDQKKVVDEKGEYPILGTGGQMGWTNSFLYNKPSVLIGRKGTINNPFYMDTPFWTIDTLFYTEIDEEKVFPKYLFYKFKLINFLRYNEATGVPSLKTDTLNRIPVTIHEDLPTQQKIANVLSALDAKIALNNRINTELEAMAKTLYDYWFVQFDFPNEANKPYKTSGGAMVWNEDLKRKIPKGWEVKALGEYSKSIGGYAFKSSEWVDEGLPVIKIKDIQEDYTLNLNDISKVDTKTNIDEKFIAKAGEVIIAMTGATIGKYAIVPLSSKKIFVNQRVGIFKLGDKPIKKLPFLINSLRQSYFREFVFSLANGAAQPNISNEQINSISLLFPNEARINEFNILFESTYEKILNNQLENQQLSSLRDWLLPMLMNGQVVVE